MTHQRQTIRSSVVTILTDASIVDSSKIYSNRSLPVDAASLPVITVYTLPETSVPRDMTTTVLRRALDVTVEAITSNSNDELTDDAVDALADQIEAALKADVTWAGTVTDSVLTETAWTKDDKGGDASIGVLRLKYKATYFF